MKPPPMPPGSGSDPGQAGPLCVEVTYALPQQAVVKTFHLHPPATIEDVLRLAAADPAFAGIDIAHAAVGVFGKLANPGQLLRHLDRVEIYRPLAADPKLARRARAKEARRKS